MDGAQTLPQASTETEPPPEQADPEPAPEAHRRRAPQPPATRDPAHSTPPKSEAEGSGRTQDAQKERAARTRALTQSLFDQLGRQQPGSAEHGRVRAALIEANLPLVRYVAARFRSRNEPMEDVVQVGTIGLINAIDRFDASRGVQFPTFAMPTIVGEIRRYFRDNVRTVHVPRRLHELWVQVSGATEDLTTLYGRSPTTAEIAERLKITEEEVLACIEAGRAYRATSLEAAQERDDGMPGLLDRLGYEDPELDGVEHRDLVRHLLVQLPEREQRILLLRYYRNLTQSQISAELGVSQMHVSRLLSRSFARLRAANPIEA
ncbi:RNA polymerase sigma factor SigF [Streptomyces xiaopingdaonensis]|uniref:RNA polymerase sigma factor SigF n=1 Tax=Streptomyces xiaopingdaonensis TaxID=1565415 RepID=UPI0002FCD066|nr:RNA polymerase sigma factor SigF [Streptomyces xiaopingdaonensis]